MRRAQPCRNAHFGSRTSRAISHIRRGGWKYLKVAEREFLFDIEYDPRERGDLSTKQPRLLAELRALWEDWDRDMLPLPTDAVAPMSNLSDMLW